MDNIKNDRYYLQRIIRDLRFIELNIRDRDLSEFAQNEILQDSMMFRLIQISENAKRLSSQYKELNHTIPWTAIYGLRNRIVHDYGNVDLTIVFNTLKIDIPDLLKMMSQIQF